MRRASQPGAEPGSGLQLVAAADRQYLLEGFRRLVQLDRGVDERLAAVLRDVVDTPGSFVRAQIAFDAGRRFGVGRQEARKLAIAVEYFHTASLLFDDLPMMDDAGQRRGRPCAHRVHGEAAAVLGALSLVNRAYALLWDVLAGLPAARSGRASELVTTCLGAAGVLGGQSLDLHPGSGAWTEEDILTVALGKTVPMIRLTLVLPALVGGADDASLRVLDRLSRSWGLAYQVLDDCKDALMSPAETGKSTARDGLLGRPNLLNHSGPARVRELLASMLAESRADLRELTGGTPWEALEKLQGLLAGESARVRFHLEAKPTPPHERPSPKLAGAAAC